jgi:hypothetical protein
MISPPMEKETNLLADIIGLRGDGTPGGHLLE